MTNTSEVMMEKQRDNHNHSALRPEPLPMWTKIADVAMRPLDVYVGRFSPRQYAGDTSVALPA